MKSPLIIDTILLHGQTSNKTPWSHSFSHGNPKKKARSKKTNETKHIGLTPSTPAQMCKWLL